jgi:pimeloyl-ACP methyl ester carboxylesterase
MATVETAPTKYAEVNGIKYAFRHLGPDLTSSTPFLFLQHFRGTMDQCDPSLINPIAQKHPVLLFDNAGVGRSTGEIPDTVQGMADHVIAFIKHLGLPPVYLYGFSLGGMIAQQVTITAPELVAKLMLVGTSPGRSPDTPEGFLEQPADPEGVSKNAGSPEPAMENLQTLFFFPSETSQKAGEKYWERIHRRNKDTSGEERSPYVPLGPGIMNMIAAGTKFSSGEGMLPLLFPR